MRFIFLYFLSIIFLASCKPETTQASYLPNKITASHNTGGVIPAAGRLAQYFPLIKNKKIALVVNQTSTINGVHIVDSLHKIGVDIGVIFAPEHGFRGNKDAGEHVSDDKDPGTGITIISLYGTKKKPTPADLQGIDVILFDIQDVGVRFYTYISTLHYIMEASAQNNIPLVVLDRPNPNGHYVDGPILEPAYRSFVGMHPVPVVYGMTIGEYAKMINGEKWLKDGIQSSLTVIPMKEYTHDTYYELPVKPSPNLPDIRSILLYPSLCFFEGTSVSVGRGTDYPFQMIGHPDFSFPFSFIPKPNAGAKTPLHQEKVCHGLDLSGLRIEELRAEKKINLHYLIAMYRESKTKNIDFFLENGFFEKLAGTESLRNMLEEDYTEETIRDHWKSDLTDFQKIRKKYLLYE